MIYHLVCNDCGATCSCSGYDEPETNSCEYDLDHAEWEDGFNLLPHENRTSTIVSLISEFERTKDISILPILADALQDSGYEGEEVSWLRDTKIQYATLKFRVLLREKPCEHEDFQCVGSDYDYDNFDYPGSFYPDE